MSSDDFQTKYASVMESMLKTAIAETTKLFETMVNELKAEISSIKKENEELKTRCSQFENARSQATVYTRENEPVPERSDGSEKRDTAVQCDLVPFRMMPVEQCQPLRHSPLQNQEQQCTHEETEYTLQEHDYGTHEEGNSQMEFILLKQKDSVLKKEEIEPTVVYGQVSKNIAGSPLVSACEIENEGPLINRECSTGEIPFPQRHEEIQVDLELPSLGPNNNLQESQNQSAELEHSLVMSLAAIKDDMEQESEVGQKISEIGTQGELLKSPKKLMVAHNQSEVEPLEKEQSSVIPQPCQRKGKMSVNEKPDVILQQCANLQSTEKQFIQSTPLNKGEAYGKLKYGLPEGNASSQPDLSVRHRRGWPPKKAIHLQPPVKKIIQSPSSDVPTEQEVKNDPTKNMEEVDITSFESPQVSLVQPEGSTSFITPSVQERGNSKVISLALSVASLRRISSSEKEKTPESQQSSMENEEGVIKAPSTSVFSAIETLNPPPAESHEPRERYTSVTLQDAMLLVEAMNQSTVENTFSSLERMATPYQTQCSLQTVDKVPVKPETLLLPVETYEAVGNVPVPVLSTATQSTKEERTTSHTTDITSTNEDFAHIKVVIAKEPHTVTLSNTATSSTATAATQTIVQSLQRHPPHSQITLVAPSKQDNALPHKIIVVPRPVSSLMHHKIAVQSPNQLPSVVSTAVAAQSNSVLPVSMASGLPLRTPSLSSVLQKSIYVKSRKSLPLDTSQTNATSADLQSGTPSHPKITIIIPRHVSAVASKKHQSQTIALATKQESSKSAAPVTVLSSQSISLSQELSISMAAQTASDEVATISCEKWDNTSDYLKSPKPTASVSETISEPTETPTSLNKSVGRVPTSISPLVQPTSEKTSAVVTLTRLPFTISAKESVLLSELPTNGSYGTQSILKEGTTQEKPVVISTQPSETLVLSTDICSDLQETSVAVSVNTSQLSDVPTDIQEKSSLSSKNCTILEESPNSWYVQPSILSAPVSENSTIAVNTTEPSAVSGISGENTSNEEEEIICIPVDDCALPNPPVEQKQSAAVVHLTSITSKDTSDPHLQMTKTQFLAKLAVSPVEDPKKASSNNPVEARASCAETSTSNKKRLQRNTLVAQLRNHLKTHFQARRTETKQESCTEIETCTVSPKKLRLEKDSPNDGDTSNGPIPCSTKSQATVEDVTSLKKTTYHPTPISPRRSGLRKDGSRSRRTFGEPTYVSFRRSKGTSESTLVSPRRSSSIKESAGPKKAKTTYVNSKRSNSIQESASLKNTRNPSVHHSRSGSTGDGASTNKTPKGSLNNTKTTPVRPKRAASPKKTKSVSPTMSNLSKNGTSPNMSSELTISRRRCTLSNDASGIKRIKRKSNSLSARRCSITTDGASTKNVKSKTSTPDVRWPKLAKDGDNPRKTGESTLAKKPRLIQDVTSPKRNLRVVNAKKIAKTAKAKALSKLKKSNQSKLQNGAKTSQLAENSASCVAVKRCTAKAVWTPPRLAASKPPPAGERASLLFSAKKETRSQNHTVVYPPSVSLYPIPVKAPPVVSPLQPLSVIGRRLLKNQCGECGCILSSSAALESHVSLHTGRRPFSCTLCGKHFSDSKGIKRHGRVHRNGRIHICQQCGKGFVYRFGLTKHLQMVHGRIKPFVCQICNKGFFTKRDVEAHVRIHTGEKPFHCNLCEKKFTRRVELNVHLRWHNGEKRHWCPYCGKGFLDLNNLKRHKYTHTGEKPHSCPHCPKHFTQSGHLKKHVKNVHKIQ